VVDDGDPLEAAVDVEEQGIPIDLRDERDELHRRLAALLDRENTLWNRGLRCGVKQRADSCCHACPFQGRKGELCNVGLEEERVLTRMAVAAQVADAS
jgi:hypothetical protein